MNDLDKCLGSRALLVDCLTNASLALGTIKFCIAHLLRNNPRIVPLPIENLFLTKLVSARAREHILLVVRKKLNLNCVRVL